jgi:hypothetical protein
MPLRHVLCASVPPVGGVAVHGFDIGSREEEGAFAWTTMLSSAVHARMKNETQW